MNQSTLIFVIFFATLHKTLIIRNEILQENSLCLRGPFQLNMQKIGYYDASEESYAILPLEYGYSSSFYWTLSISLHHQICNFERSLFILFQKILKTRTTLT